MASPLTSRAGVAALATLASVGGSMVTYGWLLAWHGWAVKWYLLTSLFAAIGVGVVVGLASPRRRIAVTAWLVAALLVGLVVAPFIGMVIVYKVGGSTD